VSYLRSIYLQKDKSVFKLDELPFERFAESLGLPGAPKVKFLNKQSAHAKQKSELREDGVRTVKERAQSREEEDDDSDDGSEESGHDDEDSEFSSGDEEESGKEADEETTTRSTAVKVTA
jgi:ATP-dependent RNA helicase DDX10/DBP4